MQSREVPIAKFRQSNQTVNQMTTESVKLGDKLAAQAEPVPELPPLKAPLRLPKLHLPKVERKERADTRSTITSTDDKKVSAELGVAAVGVLSFLVLGLQLMLRRKDGAKLREPTKQEYKAVADPIGRIAARHIPNLNSVLARDIADFTKSMGAAKEYMLSEPWEYKESLEVRDAATS